MSISVEELVSGCFDDLKLNELFAPYVQKAEEAGYPNLARLLRAYAASETVRDTRMRKAAVHHANEIYNYYVCPYCGLLYNAEAPKKCPVDKTPAKDFIVIQ